MSVATEFQNLKVGGPQISVALSRLLRQVRKAFSIFLSAKRAKRIPYGPNPSRLYWNTCAYSTVYICLIFSAFWFNIEIQTEIIPGGWSQANTYVNICGSFQILALQKRTAMCNIPPTPVLTYLENFD